MSDSTLRDRFDRLWTQEERAFGRGTVFKMIVSKGGRTETQSVTYAISPSATLEHIRVVLEATEGPDFWSDAPSVEVIFSPVLSPGNINPSVRFDLTAA